MKIGNLLISLEVIYTLAVIFTVLIICSTIFGIYYSKVKTPFSKELVIRTKSWWYIAAGVALLVAGPFLPATILLSYVSFVALREMFSIGFFRESDRVGLFVAYFSVPIQFYLAYNNQYVQFLYFIPTFMFVGIPFILVNSGQVQKIGRSMSLIPSTLILTVYMLSHIVLLYHVKFPGFEIGGGSLVLYLIILCSFNDVFQFTWGKLLGKHKIMPNVSPNKTWEGLIGGVICTIILAYFLRFLTPLNGFESLITGFVLALCGYIGGALMSAIKRDLGIKDSGNLIPGHGGAMDRLDSIIISAPAFYHLLSYFIENR